jgi:ketosteroid isomerase-like protein
MSVEKLEMVRAGYEALSRGDLDAWLAGADEDIELHELAEVPDTAVYRGHAELRRWAASAMDLVGDWQWTVQDVIYEADDRLLLLSRLDAHGASSGAPIHQEVFHLIDFSGGKVIRLRGFLDRTRALEAAGLSE